MALDPLAARLERLLAEGSIVASELSRPMRKRLTTLFRLGALVEQKSSGGKRVQVLDIGAVEAWVRTTYPSGLFGAAGALPARAEGVANFANSKRGRSSEVRPILMRGFGAAELLRKRGALPLGEMTRKYELAGVLLGQEDAWRLNGTLALVENLEAFLHVERVVPKIDAALWTAGRVDQRVIEWIARVPDVRIVHFGDYDPVGLDEYLRARDVLGDRVTLFVPDRLAEYVQRYGRADLLADSATVLERVRREGDASVRTVVEILDGHGKGLEQEALLLPLDDR